MRAFLLALTSLIFSLASRAASLAPNETPISVTTADGVRLIGREHFDANRKFNDDETPVILLHGLTSSDNQWGEFVRFFVNSNTRVFTYNWRGHGDGQYRSVKPDYQNGDYSLGNMVAYDFPAIVNDVIARTGKIPIVIGHSMGGMIPKVALSERTDGGPSIIDILNLRGKVKAFVPIESPSDLYTDSPLVQLNGYIMSLNLRFLPGDMTLSATNPFLRILIKKVAANLSPDLKKQVLEMLDSPSPTTIDILRSFLDSAVYGYLKTLGDDNNILRPGLAGLKALPPTAIPTLHIGGQKDQLVSNADVLRWAGKQPAISLENTDHFKVMVRRYFLGYIDDIVRFLRGDTMPAVSTYDPVKQAKKNACENSLR